MPIIIARAFRIRLSAAVVIGALLAAVLVSQFIRQHREQQAQRIATDLQAFESASGYGIEAGKVATADENWKAYCYRERASLIEEATVASQ